MIGSHKSLSFRDRSEKSPIGSDISAHRALTPCAQAAYAVAFASA